MNIKRLKKVAERILKYPETYNQNTFGKHNNKVPKGKYPRGLCGTTACFAGHAVLLVDKTLSKCHNSSYEIEERAREILDLTKGEAYNLFWWAGPSGNYRPTAKQAYKYIMEFIKNSERRV